MQKYSVSLESKLKQIRIWVKDRFSYKINRDFKMVIFRFGKNAEK